MKVWGNVIQAYRLFNEDGIKSSCNYIRKRAVSKLRGYPHTITFEASAVCNLRCSFCYIYKNPIVNKRDFLYLDTFKKVILETRHFLEEAMLHWRGEPLLNKDLPSMVLFASEHAVNSSFSTNGLPLTPDISRALIFSGLRRMTICLDGFTQEVYGFHRRGGDLERLKDNISTLVALKRKMRSRYPIINLQMIVTKKNLHQVGAFKNVAAKLGVDGAYLMSLFIDKTADECFLKEMETSFFVDARQGALSRYFVDNDGKIHLYEAQTPCPQDAKYPVVTSDGRLIGCCYDIMLKHVFGNCDEEPFINLWNKPQYVSFRALHMIPRKLAICENCMPKYREWTHHLF